MQQFAHISFTGRPYHFWTRLQVTSDQELRALVLAYVPILDIYTQIRGHGGKGPIFDHVLFFPRRPGPHREDFPWSTDFHLLARTRARRGRRNEAPQASFSQQLRNHLQPCLHASIRSHTTRSSRLLSRSFSLHLHRHYRTQPTSRGKSSARSTLRW